MAYIFTVILLFVLELLYFRIADKYNIIDKPNQRSSHTTITLRGGGIIFYIAILIFFIQSGFSYPWFMLGLTLMATISFLDDIVEISTRLRLAIHFTSVLLMAFQMGIFSPPWYYIIVTFIIVVGVINAYNFMDGINGITALYSLVVCGLLYYVNTSIQFIEQDYLIFALLGILVFAFFNFRNKAKCFAGDVGSVGIAYILLFALGTLIFKTGEFIYILFLAVYGVDAIWSIVRRLYLGENIMEGHRTHLYQYLANEAGYNRLVISGLYGALQLIIGIMVIYFAQFDGKIKWLFAVLIVVAMSAIYLALKNYIIKQYVLKLAK
ncbi:UDP-GlcNAc--UDP-phosphate GlcNAc-1-phosphate transferase [Sphingobacterium faecium NBRC 15299]|uniref:MraY family glycosyltransferase n=1 Tax=Sphingobacterium faecium TaxID=34087 RepID=UPI000D3C495F|nr:glycosyltransferase family 4 protein [Sphingobacterium faecium]PTX12463.1 UDP-N-acetylmuramyl pentapeptide phosphotransferase/UDP-N-acetylglucosamine-1-phosphate transferase [Sphingobacterium faecium]GEM62172.1 UDP-GlcNAc--UDP-phosphate GlcNAc-1-phosphate transferase [Sphingobacterium faecium NBRC 15299]